jgi:hypothetical protein
MTIYELIRRVETDKEYVETHFKACVVLYTVLDKQLKKIIKVANVQPPSIDIKSDPMVVVVCPENQKIK